MKYIRRSKATLFTFIIVAAGTLLYACTDNSTTGNVSGSAKISGSVTASDNGEGIESAKITVLSTNIEVETFSNSDGFFEIAEVPAGDYTVQLTLPKGYNEAGSSEKQVFAKGSTQMEFLGEPIRQITATVQEGRIDTLTTSSGASVIIDGSTANSGLEINIEEVESRESEEGRYKPFRISLNTQGMNKIAGSLNQSAVADLEGVFIRQRIQEESEWFNFIFKKEGESVETFYGGDIVESIDLNTGVDIMEFELELVEPLMERYDIFVGKAEPECSTSDKNYREFNPVLNSDTENKPVILIHGIQSFMWKCENFDDFDPKLESFDKLIDEFLADKFLSENFSLYTYKYMSIASIKENSDFLWDMIPQDLKGKKPILLAHSMGGLIGLSMVSDYGMESFSGLITLGTPHSGSYLADINFDKDLYREGRREICRGENFGAPGCGSIGRSNIFPKSQGLSDLKTYENQLFENIEPSNSARKKIFTFHGNLESLNDISNREGIKGELTEEIYRFSYRYMKEIKMVDSDAIVHVSSANPSWSENEIEMPGYDHEELKDGSDLSDLKPLFEKLKPILIELSDELTVPDVLTSTIGQITSTTAESGGEIRDSGGSEITQKGVCWSINTDPDFNDECTEEGGGPGRFVSELSGLSPKTTYFVRAYAINEFGTGFGNERTFTTEDAENPPPTVQIVNGPADGSTIDFDNPGFVWEGDDDGSVVEYEVELDGPSGESFTTTQTQYLSEGLANGPYEFSVRAVDNDGAKSSWASREFTVSVEAENPPPTVQIVNGPADGSTIDFDNPGFVWEGDDDGSIVEYEVELDGPSGESFTTTQTQYLSEGLANGPYEFSVRAVDNDGAKSSWASREFTVSVEAENPPPTVQIVNGPADGSTIDFDNPGFVWEGDDDGSIVEYEVELDGPSGESFTTTQTQYLSEGLANGPYEFSVRAVDNDGAKSSWASREFTVSVEAENPPPTVQIVNGPADGSTIDFDNPGFVWEGDDDGSIVEYEVELDGPSGESFTTTQTQYLSEGLANGPYEFSVRAVDNDGAKSSWASREFTVSVEAENPPPTVQIVNGPADGSTIDFDNPGFVWEGDDDGSIVEYEVELDGPSGESFTTTQTQYLSEGLANGPYEFSVRAVDNDGAKSSWASREFTVSVEAENPPPTVQIVNGPADGSTIDFDNPGFVWEGDDDGSIVEYEVELDGPSGESFTTTQTQYLSEGLANGPYEFSVRAVDNDGAKSSWASREFTVSVEAENPPPTVQIVNGPADGSTIDFDNPGFVWEGDDDGSIVEYEVELDGPSGESFTTTQTQYLSEGLANGPYEFSVRAVDNDGAKSTWASRSFTVDVVNPDINLDLSSSSFSIEPGNSFTINADIDRTDYNGSVTLEVVSSLPSGLSVSITQPGNGDSGSLRFSLSTNHEVFDNERIRIRASGSGVNSDTESVYASIEYTGSITMDASPQNLTIPIGGSETTNISINRSGYTGDVSLDVVSRLPSGVSYSVNDPGTGNSGSVTFRLGTSYAVFDNEPIRIRASGPGLDSVEEIVYLSIEYDGSISMSASPSSFIISPGSCEVVDVSISRSGFSGSVSITVPTSLPSGLSKTINNPGTSNSGSVEFCLATSYAIFENEPVRIKASGSGVQSVEKTVNISVDR